MMGIPYTGRGCRPASARPTRCWPSTRCATRDPDAGLLRLQRDRLRGARGRPGAARHRGAPGLPDRRQARPAGLGAGDQVRPHRGRRARRAGGGLLLRPQGAARALRLGRELAVSVLDGPTGRPALPIVEAVPEQETSMTSSPATRSAAPASSARPSSTTPVAARAADIAVRPIRCSAARGFARVDLMLDAATVELLRARGQPDPRPDRDQPAAPGRGGGRDLLRRVGRAAPATRCRRAQA